MRWIAVVIALAVSPAWADVLFKNVRVFDGKTNKLSAATNVLVKGNKIAKIGPDLKAGEGAVQVIDCGGRTLMPGLIDGHTHFAFTRALQAVKNLDTKFDIGIRSTIHARRALMGGFTTCRAPGQ